MIYLDTHVVIWMYAFGAERLSERARELIEQSSHLLISPMVLLELEFLYEIGKITVVPQAILDFLATRVALEVCPKKFQEVVSAAMRQTWARDPFDRVITAQAAVEESVLITKDGFISSHYPRAVW